MSTADGAPHAAPSWFTPRHRLGSLVTVAASLIGQTLPFPSLRPLVHAYEPRSPARESATSRVPPRLWASRSLRAASDLSRAGIRSAPEPDLRSRDTCAHAEHSDPPR